MTPDSDRTVQAVKDYTEELRTAMIAALIEWSSCDGLIQPLTKDDVVAIFNKIGTKP